MDSQIAPSIVKWFLELGIIDDQVKNHLVLNAYDVHKSIKDVQLILDQERKKLLVYVEISFWSGLFKKDEILNDVHLRIGEMLPSYGIRVTNELKIFKKALNLIKSIT